MRTNLAVLPAAPVLRRRGAQRLPGPRRSPIAKDQKDTKERGWRINHQIRTREVRVIGADGRQLGIIPIEEALESAFQQEMDLVELAPQERPPVCKIMDYGKFKYEQKKKAHEARRKQTVILVKEIKLRPRTERHDLEVKARAVLRFLSEGNKARVSVFFRGREITHLEIGQALLQQMLEVLGEAAVVESVPRMEGRAMAMTLAPGKIEAARIAPATAAEASAAESENAGIEGDGTDDE